MIYTVKNQALFFTVNLGIHVDEPQPTIPPEKPKTDYSHEAEEYEKKLIQVHDLNGFLPQCFAQFHKRKKLKFPVPLKSANQFNF